MPTLAPSEQDRRHRPRPGVPGRRRRATSTSRVQGARARELDAIRCDSAWEPKPTGRAFGGRDAFGHGHRALPTRLATPPRYRRRVPIFHAARRRHAGRSTPTPSFTPRRRGQPARSASAREHDLAQRGAAWATAAGRIEIGARTSVQDCSVLHTTPEHPTVVGGGCTVGPHRPPSRAAPSRTACLIGSGPGRPPAASSSAAARSWRQLPSCSTGPTSRPARRRRRHAGHRSSTDGPGPRRSSAGRGGLRRQGARVPEGPAPDRLGTRPCWGSCSRCRRASAEAGVRCAVGARGRGHRGAGWLSSGTEDTWSGAVDLARRRRPTQSPAPTEGFPARWRWKGRRGSTRR